MLVHVTDYDCGMSAYSYNRRYATLCDEYLSRITRPVQQEFYALKQPLVLFLCLDILMDILPYQTQ